MSIQIRRDTSHCASAGSRVPVQMWWAHKWKSVAQVQQGDDTRHFHRWRWKFGSVNFFFCAQQIMKPQVTFLERITSDREDFNVDELGHVRETM